MMAAAQGHEPQDAPGQRRKAQRTAWRLGLFALAVYIAFIIAFINRH